MSQPWLTDDQLRDLTGYVQPARQVRWLEQNRIKHYISRLNKVRVPPEAVAGFKPSIEKRTEPDFTKIRKAHGAN